MKFKMTDVKIVNIRTIHEIIEKREPEGLFISEELHKNPHYHGVTRNFVAVDNRNGEAFTEAFADLDSAMIWLEEGHAIEEFGFCSECGAHMWAGYMDEVQGESFCIEHKPEDVDGEDVFYTEWVL